MLIAPAKLWVFFFFQAEDGIRDVAVTGVQTCALPISGDRELYPAVGQIDGHGGEGGAPGLYFAEQPDPGGDSMRAAERRIPAKSGRFCRSEEHTSELQSRLHLVCRLLLEKKKKTHLSN